MIKTGLNIIDSMREIINVPDVMQYVDFIRPFESVPSDYSNKKKFIVIGFLAGNADDLQRATVNINAFAPDNNAGSADIAFFNNVERELIEILMNAWYDDMEITIAMTPKTMKVLDVEGYHFSNIRLNIFYPSITIV